MQKVKIADIIIKERIRKDYGNIQELADSIQELGLLQPIGITENKELVFGERRIMAYKELDLDEIEYITINIKHLIFGECAENEIRKRFTSSERLAIAEKVKESIVTQAKLKEKKGFKQLANNPVQALAQGSETYNQLTKSRDKIAKIVGFGSGETYRQAQKVAEEKNETLIEAVDKKEISIEDAYNITKQKPEIKKKVIEQLKEKPKKVTGKELINKAKKEIRKKEIQQQKQAIEDGEIELPQGLFEVIVIDPPWDYGTNEAYDSEGYRSAGDYPVLSIEEISQIDLPYAHDCVLWLWTTHKFMRYCFSLIDKWGFEEKAILTWVKNKMGTGRWLRSKSEFCIMAIKGNPKIDLTNQTTVLEGKMREHSRKPDEFYKMVDDLCIGRKLDYFARQERKNWSIMGVEKW